MHAPMLYLQTVKKFRHSLNIQKWGSSLVDCGEFTGRNIMRPLNNAWEDYAARCKIAFMTLC